MNITSADLRAHGFAIPSDTAPAPKQRGRGVQHKPGVMNKTERAYSEHLEMRKHVGELLWWKFEAVTFKLAHDTRYTPDFMVMLADGVLELHEVKGHMEDDAWVKSKICAEMFPFRVIIVKKSGNGWSYRVVGPADAGKDSHE